MSDIRLLMGPIRDNPESQDMVRWFRAELESRKMPTTWPDDDRIYQASLYFNDAPLTMLMFVPLEERRIVLSAGAYTMPSWRRIGLYDYLFGLCINHWRKRDEFDWFLSGFHKNNDASRAMQISQGREFYEQVEDYQRTRISLRPTGDEFELCSAVLQPLIGKLEYLSG